MEGSVELLLCAVRSDGGEEGGVDRRACASHTRARKREGGVAECESETRVSAQLEVRPDPRRVEGRERVCGGEIVCDAAKMWRHANGNAATQISVFSVCCACGGGKAVRVLGVGEG